MAAQYSVLELKYNEEGVRVGERTAESTRASVEGGVVGGSPAMGDWLHAQEPTKWSEYIKDNWSRFSHQWRRELQTQKGKKKKKQNEPCDFKSELKVSCELIVVNRYVAPTYIGLTQTMSQLYEGVKAIHIQ